MRRKHVSLHECHGFFLEFTWTFDFLGTMSAFHSPVSPGDRENPADPEPNVQHNTIVGVSYCNYSILTTPKSYSNCYGPYISQKLRF